MRDLIPHYVGNEADKSLMESDPICRPLLDWHRELVAERLRLKAAKKFAASMKLWVLIDPLWRALKASFVRAGGVVSEGSAVAVAVAA